MASCKQCGAEFKPYWSGTDVENRQCEHCAYEMNPRKGQQLILAFVKVVVGILLVVVSVTANLFFGKVAGFVILFFGVLRLVEVAIISQSPSPHRP